MADSPRWCEHCQEWGDHHTDRHAVAAYQCPVEFCGWKSNQRPTTWPCCPVCLNLEDKRSRLIEKVQA